MTSPLSADTPSANFRHVQTSRLSLDVPRSADLEELYELHHDARSWRHNPGRRHTSPERAQRLIESSRERFASDGLSYWSVRELGKDRLIGWAGCSMPSSLPWWNLTYRIHPDYWGRGYAIEAAEAGVAAAHSVAPEVTVLAFLVKHNAASKTVAERCGLIPILVGPDRSMAGSTRVVYLDRTPSQSTIETIAENMFPSKDYCHLDAGHVPRESSPSHQPEERARTAAGPGAGKRSDTGAHLT